MALTMFLGTTLFGFPFYILAQRRAHHEIRLDKTNT